MKNIVVMASGNGSNFESISKYFANKLRIRLITDNENAYVIKRAQKLSISYTIVNRNDFKDKKSFNNKIFELLKSFSPNLIVLAGYMRILPTRIVRSFENKIVNIHPSLLPAFKGKDAITRAFGYGVEYTGITIHYVDEKVDHGKIIKQEIVKIDKNEGLSELEKRIHKIENAVYPKIIEKILKEEKYD